MAGSLENDDVKRPRLRVCLCSSQFDPIQGGAERQAKRLAQVLRERGHEVFVVTQRLRGHAQHEVVDGVPVFRAIKTIHLGPLHWMSYVASLAIFLMRHRHRFDILQVAHLYLDAFSATLIKPLMKRKIVLRPACEGDFGDLARLERLRFWSFTCRPNVATQRWALRSMQRADAFVCLSRGLERELEQAGFPASRVVSVPNGVDTTVFSPVDALRRRSIRRELGLPDQRTVMFVGRLDPQKGTMTLIRAMRAVIGSRPDVQCVIVGDGPQRGDCEALARELGIADRVVFVGMTASVDRYLQAADVFVLPSLAEGMSGALLEALAAGLPCVVTAIGGNVDVIEDSRNGLLVDTDDPEQLSAAICRILEDDRLASRLGAAARALAEQKYEMSRVADQYLELYTRLLSPGVGPSVSIEAQGSNPSS